ncbi:MAG: c-di-GMP-binding flagellar brake protein YcgR [Paraglaciecola sp.]|jgi:c-di-GMP-binding flagellar brake protein YcgR
MPNTVADVDNPTATDIPHNQIISHNVRMGQFVDVEILNELHDRFKSFLIGAKDGKYLVLEQPDSKRYGFVRDQLCEGQSIVIRTICEQTTGECIAFRSVVEGIINHPRRLLFVSFPDDIQKRELRGEQRTAIRYPAEIYMMKKANRIKGVITDISDGGCRFEFRAGETVKGIKQEYIYIEFEHPDTGQVLELTSKVCSQRKEMDVISIGIAFDQAIKVKS